MLYDKSNSQPTKLERKIGNLMSIYQGKSAAISDPTLLEIAVAALAGAAAELVREMTNEMGKGGRRSAYIKGLASRVIHQLNMEGISQEPKIGELLRVRNQALFSGA